jgi:hypothetical protein
MSYRKESPASLLDDVRIASPCPANWDEMIGDDRVRFCGQCTKNVYNLSALPRGEAEALFHAAESRQGEGICVRLYRRADGTVLTADCPDGARRKKRRLALFSAVGGGLMAAGAAAVASANAFPLGHDDHPVTMGAVPMPELPTPLVPVPALTGPGGSNHSWTSGAIPPSRLEREPLVGKVRAPRALTGEPVRIDRSR